MALPSVLSSDPCSHVSVECIINKECCTVWNFALICCRFSFALPVYLLPSFLSPLCFLPVHQSLTNEYLISAFPRTAHFTNLRPGPYYQPSPSLLTFAPFVVSLHCTKNSQLIHIRSKRKGKHCLNKTSANASKLKG